MPEELELQILSIGMDSIRSDRPHRRIFGRLQQAFSRLIAEKKKSRERPAYLS